MNATLFVCTTCRAGEAVVEGQPVPGARLYAALTALAQTSGPKQPLPAGNASEDPTSSNFAIRPVECLSACGNGCVVALSAPGCWSYVYGRLTADDAPVILAGAASYAATSDGLVPWRERPEIFRRQSLARLPPQER